MDPTVGPGELVMRFSAFAIVFVLMAALEVARPMRRLGAPRLTRWATNLSIVGLGVATVRVLSLITSLIAVPLVALAAAFYAADHRIGLLNAAALPAWVKVVLALVALDFALWLQHYLSHRLPLLWRLHRMHHADVDLDVSTALRFHPIEIGLSMIYKVAWVVALGAPPLAVLLFEVILNACSMFNHANVALPTGLDRVLRRLLVTPDMHRVHHSVLAREHNSNFGFNLSLWDRLFATYSDQPEHGHRGMTIGLPAYQSSAPTRLAWSLLMPFEARGSDQRERGTGVADR